MTINRALVGIVSFLQIIILPLLYPGFTNLSWSWQLGCALAMVLMLGLIPTQAQMDWLVLAAGGLGVLACVGQWRLLPLVVAQIALTVLISTQSLTPQWEATGWLLVVFFVQGFLMYLVLHTLTLALLMLLALLTLPLLVAIWGDHLSLVVMIGLLIILAVIGYWLQQLTLLAALGTIVMGTVLSSRFVRPQPVWYAAGGIVITLIFTLTRLHG